MTSYPPPPAAATAVPLWAPYYGASLPTAFLRFWQKYATFSGRASRSEYWWWYLVVVIVGGLLDIVALVSFPFGQLTSENATSISFGAGFWFVWAVSLVWGLGTIVPTLALTVRRLHDVNLSGWFLLLAFVPFGAIAVLVMTVLDSNPAGQRFDRPF